MEKKNVSEAIGSLTHEGVGVGVGQIFFSFLQPLHSQVSHFVLISSFLMIPSVSSIKKKKIKDYTLCLYTSPNYFCLSSLCSHWKEKHSVTQAWKVCLPLQTILNATLTCCVCLTGREFVAGAELDWPGGARDAARAAQVLGFSGTAINVHNFINFNQYQQRNNHSKWLLNANVLSNKKSCDIH